MPFPAMLAQDILRKGYEYKPIRDEIFLQIIKQLTNNPRPESVAKGWQVMCMCVGTFPPSYDFENYLLHYILEKRDKGRGAVVDYARYVYCPSPHLLSPSSTISSHSLSHVPSPTLSPNHYHTNSSSHVRSPTLSPTLTPNPYNHPRYCLRTFISSPTLTPNPYNHRRYCLRTLEAMLSNGDGTGFVPSVEEILAYKEVRTHTHARPRLVHSYLLTLLPSHTTPWKRSWPTRRYNSLPPSRSYPLTSSS